MLEEAVRFPADAVAPQEILLYRWTGADGEQGKSTSRPGPTRATTCDGQEFAPRGNAAGDGWRITLEAEALALFVSVEVEGRLSDNCFALLPGTPRAVHLATDAVEAPALRIRGLHSATYN